MSNGKTYEIFCKRGLNREICKFRKQDPELHCANCNFAGFIERTKENINPEPFEWSAEIHSCDDGQQ